MSLPSDPGVQVAPGDPGQLSAAATWHSNLADGLDSHAATIDGTAGSLAPTWQGDAASSYQALSSMVAAHFRGAASTSRTAAASLRRYASELERCQQEGKQALTQATHWLAEARADQVRLTAAQNAVTAAQAALTTAQSEANAAANVVGHAAAGLAAAAASRVQAAQDALTRAQTDARDAQRALTDAEHQLAHWQTRGRQAWQEAVQAAEAATGSLEPLSVAPPPLAAGMAFPLVPNAPVDWFGLGAGAFGGFWTTVAKDNLSATRAAIRAASSEWDAAQAAADNPELSPAARAAAAERAGALEQEMRGLLGSESGINGSIDFGEHFLGNAVGGAGDALIRIASGENVVRSSLQGAFAAGGSAAGTSAAVAGCAAIPIVDVATPVCGALGGAAGGVAGDLLGGLADDGVHALGSLIGDL